MIHRLTTYIIPLSLLLLPACSQHDEPGAEPRRMEFSASISSQTQTRVSETADGMESKWSTGDRILVQVTQDNIPSSAYCTLNEKGAVTAYTTDLYWNGGSPAKVVAWYSNITGSNTTATTTTTVNLADQRDGLAYVLRATATANYGSPIPLTFSHQLAKVRVEVTGDGDSEINTVKINNYLTCSISDGVVTAGTEGYITMGKNGVYFEANVIPVAEGNLPAKLLDFGEYYNVEVNGITAFEAGKIYTIKVDIAGGSGSSVETTFNGHPAVLMREAGMDNYYPEPLYVSTMNLGASAPDDLGLYFWWGGVEGKERDDETKFKFLSTNSDIITYNQWDTLESKGIINSNGHGEEFRLTAAYDAAKAMWGKEWEIPTANEMWWLIDEEECEWTYQNGSYVEDETAPGGFRMIYPGYKVKSKTTGGEIFLPMWGYKNDTSPSAATEGWYWTSNPFEGDETRSKALKLTTSTQEVEDRTNRYYGLLIRPISYGNK